MKYIDYLRIPLEITEYEYDPELESLTITVSISINIPTGKQYTHYGIITITEMTPDQFALIILRGEIDCEDHTNGPWVSVEKYADGEKKERNLGEYNPPAKYRPK